MQSADNLITQTLEVFKQFTKHADELRHSAGLPNVRRPMPESWKCCHRGKTEKDEETVPSAPSAPMVMSDKLKQMIEEMNKTIVPHTDVYPPKPRKGAILIPTGGLVRCQCSADCKKELPEPAYRELTDCEKKQMGMEPGKLTLEMRMTSASSFEITFTE